MKHAGIALKLTSKTDLYKSNQRKRQIPKLGGDGESGRRACINHCIFYKVEHCQAFQYNNDCRIFGMGGSFKWHSFPPAVLSTNHKMSVSEEVFDLLVPESYFRDPRQPMSSGQVNWSHYESLSPNPKLSLYTPKTVNHHSMSTFGEVL